MVSAALTPGRMRDDIALDIEGDVEPARAAAFEHLPRWRRR